MPPVEAQVTARERRHEIREREASGASRRRTRSRFSTMVGVEAATHSMLVYGNRGPN